MISAHRPTLLGLGRGRRSECLIANKDKGGIDGGVEIIRLNAPADAAQLSSFSQHWRRNSIVRKREVGNYTSSNMEPVGPAGSRPVSKNCCFWFRFGTGNDLFCSLGSCVKNVLLVLYLIIIHQALQNMCVNVGHIIFWHAMHY